MASSSVVGWVGTQTATSFAVTIHVDDIHLALSLPGPRITARIIVVAVVVSNCVDSLWSRRHPRSCRPCGRHYKPLPCLLLLLLLVVVVQLLRDDFQGSGCCCLLLLPLELSWSTPTGNTSSLPTYVEAFKPTTKAVGLYLGNTVRVASGVTEQVGRATIRVLPRARRSWSVAIQVVRVFVGQTISVLLVPGSHLSVTEVLRVCTGANVWRIRRFTCVSILSALSPHLPDEVDETVM